MNQKGVIEMENALEAVRTYLAQFGLAARVRAFAVSSATVELAAQALQVEPARIAKTISCKWGDGCVLLVMAGDCKVDNKKFKALFHTKARMLTAQEVEPLTGHPIGGVCPFCYPDSAKVYLDLSLRRFSTVFPAAGTPSSAVELSCDELAKVSRCEGWVDVSKSALAVPEA